MLLAYLIFFVSCVEAICISFVIELTWEVGSPDGVSRNMIFVNGTSPGPPLILDQGDTVEFTVLNHLPFNSAVHFHGITQLGTPWSDGVPGVSQKPIEPGQSFVYRWTADDYGTYFYHGHAQNQISNGLYGPIHIRPQSTELSPFHLIDPDAIQTLESAAESPELIIVSDWFHIPQRQVQQAETNADYDIYCTNSILVNGKGAVHCLPQQEYEKIAAPSTLTVLNGTKITDSGCSPPLFLDQGNFTHHPETLPSSLIYSCNETTGSKSIFTVDPDDEWVSFNFISATTVQAPVVSIDEHTMWVYAVDGRYITPQHVDGFQIVNGERYAVMVKLDQTPGDYPMRFNNLGFNQIISGFASMSYANGQPLGRPTKPYYSYAGANLTSSVVTLSPGNLPPFPPSAPSSTANATHILNIGRNEASYKWTLSGNASYPAAYQHAHPLLWYPNSTAAMDPSLVIRTQNSTWVDIVMVVSPSSAAPLQPPHPIHKHSNKGYIIGVGAGAFTWSTVADAMQAVPQFFNLDTPPHRDSFVTPPAVAEPVWLVMRYQSMNPGAFIMHCHIQTHLAGGMAMAILDGVDAFPKIPEGYGPGPDDDQDA